MRGTLRLAVWLALLFGTAVSPAFAQPANDDCASAKTVTSVPYTDVLDVAGATTALNDPEFACQGNGSPDQELRSVWYTYTATAAVTLEVDTFGSDYGTTLNAWTGACGGALTQVACMGEDADEFLRYEYEEQARILVTLAAGETVLIEVTDDDLVSSPRGDRLVLHVRESATLRVGAYSEDTVNPSVAAAPDGTFLVVWQDDTNPRRILAQRYDADGVASGPPAQLNESAIGWTRTRVAFGGTRYLAVWGAAGPPSLRDLFGRALTLAGAPDGGEFLVAASAEEYRDLEVAGDASDEFVVTWQGDYSAIPAQRVSATGTLLGPPFVANSTVGGSFSSPSVAVAAAGQFVVTWERDYDVFARRFDASGAPLGGDFLVSAATNGTQLTPAVAVRPDDGFVIAWTNWDDSTPSCGPYCVVGQLFDAAGVKSGGEFVVSDNPDDRPSFDYGPDVAVDGAGGFVVAWDRTYIGPAARRFSATAAPVGAPFLVTPFQTYRQVTEDVAPRDVASAPDGDFMVVWQMNVGGSADESFGRHVGSSEAVCAYRPRSDCRQGPLLQSKLVVKDRAEDDRDLVSWKWVKGAEILVDELGDPLTTEGGTLCVYDSDPDYDYNLTPLILDPGAEAGGTCAGVPCWKDKGAKGFLYKDPESTPSGMKKLLLKPGADGYAKVVAQGYGVGLAQRRLPIVPPVQAQVQLSNGLCFEAVFDALDVVKNTSAAFVAKLVP